MDNECPNVVKEYLTESKNIELMLVPPCMHRVNAAEKAIDIFKSHFITGLDTVDLNFPLYLWCRLLPLATTTLNLLRPCAFYWDTKGQMGWHIGMAPLHYRCHKIHAPKTRSERIAKKVKFYPHKNPVPENKIRINSSRSYKSYRGSQES